LLRYLAGTCAELSRSSILASSAWKHITQSSRPRATFLSRSFHEPRSQVLAWALPKGGSLRSWDMPASARSTTRQGLDVASVQRPVPTKGQRGLLLRSSRQTKRVPHKVEDS